MLFFSLNMETEVQFMEKRSREARSAAAAGEVPIGAVLLHDGKSLPVRTIARFAITIRRARRDCRHSRSRAPCWKLSLTDTTLYVTIEPCSMCAGAIVQARIPPPSLRRRRSQRRRRPLLLRILSSSRPTIRWRITPASSPRTALRSCSLSSPSGVESRSLPTRKSLYLRPQAVPSAHFVTRRWCRLPKNAALCYD